MIMNANDFSKHRKPVLSTLLASLATISVSSGELVAYFTFDDDGDLGANTGSVATDWTVFNNVTQTPGLFGAGAGSFVAGSSQAWDDDFNVGNLEEFSISLHVKSNQTASWDDFVSIGTGNEVVFVLERNGGEGVSLYNIGNVGGAGNDGISYGPGTETFDVDDGEWHHLGMTVGAGEVTLYIDGEARGSRTYEGSGPISAFQLASRFGAGVRAITSEIDDVAVYNETLTAEEMAVLSENPAQATAAPGVPQVVNTVFDGETFEVQAVGLIPGRSYRLMRSPDLATGFSEQVGESLEAVGESEAFLDPTPPQGQGFYRIEEAP